MGTSAQSSVIFVFGWSSNYQDIQISLRQATELVSNRNPIVTIKTITMTTLMPTPILAAMTLTATTTITIVIILLCQMDDGNVMIWCLLGQLSKFNSMGSPLK